MSKNKEPKDGRVKALLKKVNSLEKENDRLKSELKTLNEYFKKTDTYLRDKLQDRSIEEILNIPIDHATKARRTILRIFKEAQNEKNKSKK